MMFATRYCIFFRKRRSIKIHHQQQNHYPFQPYAFMHRRRDENASQPSRNAFDIILNVKSLLVPSHDHHQRTASPPCMMHNYGALSTANASPVVS
jgi:hypothetical protein